MTPYKATAFPRQLQEFFDTNTCIPSLERRKPYLLSDELGGVKRKREDIYNIPGFWDAFCTHYGVTSIAKVEKPWEGDYSVDTEDYPGDVYRVNGSKIQQAKLFLVCRHFSPPYDKPGPAELEVLAASPPLELETDGEHLGDDEECRVYRAVQEKLDKDYSVALDFGATPQFRMSRTFRPPFTDARAYKTTFKELDTVSTVYAKFVAIQHRSQRADDARINQIVASFGV